MRRASRRKPWRASRRKPDVERLVHLSGSTSGLRLDARHTARIMRFMSTVCGHCRRTLEYTGEPPKFCAYCGVPLHAAATVSYGPAAPAEASPNAPTLAFHETGTRGGAGDDTA